MTQREPLSNEALLAVLNERQAGNTKLLSERIDQLRIDYGNLAATVKEGFAENVRAHERAEKARDELLSHVGALATTQDGLVDWKTKHDVWHGPNDETLKERIDHDASVRRSVWKAQYAYFFGGGGLVAAIAVIANLLGYL